MTENLERFPQVGNILSIKAYFWGCRNCCNRWTLVTCRVDTNWTSEGLVLGLGDIKVNDISRKDQLCTKLIGKQKRQFKRIMACMNLLSEQDRWETKDLPLRWKNIEWNWQVIILQNIETQTFKYTHFILSLDISTQEIVIKAINKHVHASPLPRCQ